MLCARILCWNTALWRQRSEKHNFPKKLFKVFRFKKTEKWMKIEDQEGEAGKIFLNAISANLWYTSSTLGLQDKPGINYQQYGPFLRLKNTICVLSFLLLHIVGRMRSELGLTSEHCYNIVRNNTHTEYMTKSRKRVFRLSDLQKLVSTI